MIKKKTIVILVADFNACFNYLKHQDYYSHIILTKSQDCIITLNCFTFANPKDLVKKVQFLQDLKPDIKA